MKTPGEAAKDLPWLAPSVASMTTLARAPLPSVWTQVRTDPGIVLLLARTIETPTQAFFPTDSIFLEGLLRHRPHFATGFVDWAQPGPAPIHRVCVKTAALASQLAVKVGGDDRLAWLAGFLAPLGWLALTAADAGKTSYQTDLLRKNTWGHDHAALARRMCRAWRLPPWLSAIVGHLGLPSGIAERLGAPPQLFALVQLATSILESRGHGLGLTVGTETADLLFTLGIDANDVDALTDAELPTQTWEAPATNPLLVDLLELALENRRQNDAVWIERLQQELDCLQQALAQQCADEKGRLQSSKLSALAEFAAGAGHEINNPLAVISGQAQYVLKQMDWLDVPAEEIENVGEYLEGLRGKIAPSLGKIIGQTQRIHSILTELMQFARPAKPRLQPVSVSGLIQEVAQTWQSLAEQRNVCLTLPEITHDEVLNADPKQARLALGALVRNAIEAAPAEGWVRVRIEKKPGHLLELIVDDSGPGPAPTICEHLFDPFFCGRSAGRGRGMGLPTAWRFARQHGGDVRFDGNHDGATRFVLTLPLVPNIAIAPYTNGKAIRA